jgi:hypothetical protein
MVTAAATGAAVALRRRGGDDDGADEGGGAPGRPPVALAAVARPGGMATPADDLAGALDAARERLRAAADTGPGTPRAA